MQDLGFSRRRFSLGLAGRNGRFRRRLVLGGDGRYVDAN
jgi:hypothetical protein